MSQKSLCEELAKQAERTKTWLAQQSAACIKTIFSNDVLFSNSSEFLTQLERLQQVQVSLKLAEKLIDAENDRVVFDKLRAQETHLVDMLKKIMQDAVAVQDRLANNQEATDATAQLFAKPAKEVISLMQHLLPHASADLSTLKERVKTHCETQQALHFSSLTSGKNILALFDIRRGQNRFMRWLDKHFPRLVEKLGLSPAGHDAVVKPIQRLIDRQNKRKT